MRDESDEQLAQLGAERATRLQDSDKRLKLILDNLFSYVALLDMDGKVTEVNRAPPARGGYRYNDVIGRYFQDTPWWSYDVAIQSQLIQAIEAARRGRTSRYDTVVKMGEDLVPIDFQISPVYDPDGHIFGMLPTAVDISDRKRFETEVSALAYTDGLTGLPNRRTFHNRLQQAIDRCEESDDIAVLMMINLDRFKDANDSWGHEAGDTLLKEAANRIWACIPDSDTVCRMGGDEFAVILHGSAGLSEITRVARDILRSLSEEFVILDDITVFLSASMGLAVFPDDAFDAADLIRFADRAMYQAKNSGPGRFQFFTRPANAGQESTTRLASDLRRALDRRQMEVHYQPIAELATGRIAKAEALLRWKHPDYGYISPSSFIPIAEETGMINQIGDWAFDQAALTAKRWREITRADFQISVNKSPVQFLPGAMDHGHWVERLEALGLPTRNLAVEITESLMMSDDPKVKAELRKYREAGLQLAIDDFGTGFSALLYLKKFDIDYLKIDQSFINNVDSDATDRALCEAIVAMAHKLDIKVIAEGIETVRQHDVLKEIGCDYGQGYLFSRPVTAAVFEAIFVVPSWIALSGNDG